MEIEIDGQTYRVGNLDARTQFHIVRRLVPVFGGLASSLPAIKAGGEAAVLDALPKMASAIARLSDDDADYCIFGLLKVVSRKQPNGLGWGPVATGNALMYDDIGMAQMLRLAWEALSSNMGGFFAALPSALSGGVQKPSAK